MKVLLAIISIVCILLGCASKPEYKWDRQGGVDRQQWERDVRECVQRTMATVQPPTYSNNDAGDTFLNVPRVLMYKQAQEQSMNNCISSKGYYQRKVKD